MITVEADAGEEWDSSTDWPRLAERGVRAALAASAYAELIDAPLEVEVSVKFAIDDDVHRLNSAWRGKDEPTNVLSFPMVEPELLRQLARGDGGELLLGDIVLARGVCAREALDKEVGIDAHATHLVVHGMLHLLGYDHENGDEDAAAMERIERDALASLGIADPYAVTEV